ncbi:hypothetical protein KQX54_014299 [Cotesia glomerata]|uniref:Uncharacterized protein n=1 Tax=Cotesia glomerata TaxID=32391 RepID=A0AAV7IWP1_COTGL|nr:hypothetical protein KQX54_014299 [Cotesia glomerata]
MDYMTVNDEIEWHCRNRIPWPIAEEDGYIRWLGAYIPWVLSQRVATGRPFDLTKASANSESWEFDWVRICSCRIEISPRATD